MKTPETSRLFTRWTNPANGVDSFILTERAAPVQQSFYYTHPSWSDDGRFLWLGCGYPPPGGMHSRQLLGVVDLERDELRVYPETEFTPSRPWIDHATGDAYWCNHLDAWKRGPLAGDRAVRINTFPEELVDGKLFSLASHPTFSADRKFFNLDVRFIRSDGTIVIYIGDMPMDGSPFRVWQKFTNLTYDHGLFSPIDPDVQMFALEFWLDQERAGVPFDGATPYHRLWLIRRGESARPILNAPISHSGHEWWDPDGKHVWYLHYGHGVKKVRVATGRETMMWPGALAHAHSDRTGRYLVADRMDHPYNPDCNVLFYDTVTGKEVEIVNRPPLSSHLTRCTHLHPHPQFCLGDRYICYTTTIHDRVDIALVPVADLIRRTA